MIAYQQHPYDIYVWSHNETNEKTSIKQGASDYLRYPESFDPIN